MSKIPPVKGTRDFYPEDMAVRNWIMDGWRNTSLRHGFLEYDGPIFEHLQLYTVKSGQEIVEQLFSLTDRGGRDLAIRPEITPTLARMVNQRINALARPIKWFSLPRLCRAERPQKGRLREFFQWNIDIIGEDSVLADAECICTAVDYLRSVGLTPNDVVVRYSSRALLRALLLERLGFGADELDALYALLDKRAKLPPDTFAALARDKIPDEPKRTRLLDTLRDVRNVGADALDALDCLPAETLRQLRSHLQQFGVADYCCFDINIVRGLAYYTGVVFEIFDKTSPLRALCGGGRYDNLLTVLGGPAVPATGFGMGDVVLEILLREKNLLPVLAAALDYFVIDAASNIFDFGDPCVLSVVSRLRALGFSAAFSYKRQPLAKQLSQASAAGARFAVLLGQETRDRDQVTLKNLATGRQSACDLPRFLADPRSACPA